MKPYRDTQHAYETIRAYFGRAGSRLAFVLLSEDPAFGGTCRYRTPGGCACALGCLIPDHLYDPRIEGCSAYSLIESADNRDHEIAELFGSVNFSFIRSAQDAHDTTAKGDYRDDDGRLVRVGDEDWQQVAHFLGRLDELALEHNLTIPVS